MNIRSGGVPGERTEYAQALASPQEKVAGKDHSAGKNHWRRRGQQGKGGKQVVWGLDSTGQDCGFPLGETGNLGRLQGRALPSHNFYVTGSHCDLTKP